MKSLWNAAEGGNCPTELTQRVYTSQLLGRDHTLVLHGGGNTSVKAVEKNAFGESEELLLVKSSGWDLETIQAADFSPVRMQNVFRFAQLEVLPDPQIMNELSTQLTRAGASEPSVETILYAILPSNYVDHTHVDAILAVTITANGSVANKIGTYMVAVLARRHNIPFYVACPLSTIDLGIPGGRSIPIEERAASEVTGFRDWQWAAEGVSARNPAFDVTPAELVTALITEKGVVSAPDCEKTSVLFR